VENNNIYSIYIKDNISEYTEVYSCYIIDKEGNIIETIGYIFRELLGIDKEYKYKIDIRSYNYQENTLYPLNLYIEGLKQIDKKYKELIK